MAFFSNRRRVDAHDAPAEHLVFPTKTNLLSPQSLYPLDGQDTGPNTNLPFVYSNRYPHQWIWKCVNRLSFRGSFSATDKTFWGNHELKRQIDVSYEFSNLGADLKTFGDSGRRFRRPDFPLLAFVIEADVVPFRERLYDVDGNLTDDTTTSESLTVFASFSRPSWSTDGFALPCSFEVGTTEFSFRTNDTFDLGVNLGSATFPNLGSTPFRIFGGDEDRSNLSCSLDVTVVSEF